MNKIIRTQLNTQRSYQRNKNSLMSSSNKLFVIFILILNSIIIHPVRGSSIICSKSEYVTSGIEFKKCQDETLQSFQPENSHAKGKK